MSQQEYDTEKKGQQVLTFFEQGDFSDIMSERMKSELVMQDFNKVIQNKHKS